MTIDETRAWTSIATEGVYVSLRLPFEARYEFEERLVAASRTLKMFADAQRYPRTGVAGQNA
eukprot:386337-Alexandrium_andersonii.AAC.1